MVGWLFAVALLVAILGFELAMYRYVVDDGPGGDTSLDTAETAAAGGDPDRASADPDGTARNETTRRECHNCGTANDAGHPIRYCRRCLARMD